ncbi:MAG: type V CRISPR-associated protein Cas12a/Cpf1 [Planctomycetaceae bacterium]|jgi:hypothetical protein|nr:type V CRISPR-associated protein Cas12a/Cpf1 [Planctomycetaceae bacterium]
MLNFNNFTNFYSIVKTLRFELKPEYETGQLIGTLLEQTEEKSTEKKHHESIQNDLELSESYKKVKQLMDCKHREIIDTVLSSVSFTKDELNELEKLNSDNKEEEYFDQDEIENNTKNKKDPFSHLRKKIADALKTKAQIMFNKKILNSSYKNKEENDTENEDAEEISTNKKNKKKEKCELEKWLDHANEKYLELANNKTIDKEAIRKDLERMQRFFTYFSGFNQNRENVYSDDKIATAIPFRIVNDNFPIFRRNMENYKKIRETYPELAAIIDKKGVKEIFQLNYFNQCLTQEGIDIYNKEKLGIVAKEQGKEQEKGINQIINEYAQQKNKDIKESTPKDEKPKKVKIAVFDKLKKQILSINKTKSFQFEVFEDTSEVIGGINKRYNFLIGTEKNKLSLIDEIKNFLKNIASYDLEDVYLNERFISKLSKKLFDNGSYIATALERWYDDNNEIKKIEKDKEKFLSSKQFSIQLIHRSIKYYMDNYEQNQTIKNKYQNCENIIVDYFKNPTITIEYEQNEETIAEHKKLFDELVIRKNNINYILNEPYNKDLKEEKEAGSDSEKVKAFLDALLEFHYILSPFFVKDKNIEKDEEFYNERKRLQELLFEVEILDVYNQTRNYITQKPYKLDKFRLMFEAPHFAGGWDKNKERDYQTVILRKDKFYYLAIMDKKSKSVFEDENLDTSKIEKKLKKEREILIETENKFKNKKEGTKIFNSTKEKIKIYQDNIATMSKTIDVLNNTSEIYTKVDYKYFKDCHKMIPKCSIQTNKVKNHFKNSSKNFVIEKDTGRSTSSKGFVKELVISKEIFDLHNQVFDKDTKTFVPKKEKDETRPKKFQKEYFEHSKDQKGYLAAIKKWIGFCKLFLESYESTATAGYDYGDVFEQQYEDISTFYDKLDTCIYKLTVERKISAAYIRQLVQDGKIYLFKIHNKDFNPGSTGKKNLHTLYWEMLFDQKNLEDVVFQLNGDAKLFYREASNIKNNTIHETGIKAAKKFFELPDGTLEPVPAQSIKNLNNYFSNNTPIEKWNEADKKYKDNFSIIGRKENKIGITKDERFTKDKIQFHCPITINFKSKAKKKITNINNDVLDFLYRRDDVHIIGLDRGERNLIYLTMIDQDGKIVDGMQFSLNELERQYEFNGQNKSQKINYHELLQKKEVSRTEARKNWQTIENIKELKEGYLSLVIHQLAKLMVEKNAIIVMEDLNYGFKDNRAKVEKQIYQKFENMLIRKLQYLVTDKDNLYDTGGILKAYQLTNAEIPSYKDMSKQVGFLFYVPPDYTSKIDPVTGFVNLLDTRYTNIKNAVELLNKFDTIYYDTKNHYFRFEFDYKNFDKLRVDDVKEFKRTKWSVCSHNADRSIAERQNNKWIRRSIDIQSKLTELFEKYITDFKSGKCLKESICKVNDAKFFENLLKYLYILLSVRHTWKDDKGNEYDTIVSSVELVQGSNEFYCSDVEKKKGTNKDGRWISELPVDADANGAYNIACKGLLLLKKLNEIDDKEKAINAFNDLKKAKEELEKTNDKKTKDKKIKDEKTEDKKTKKKKVSQWCPNKEWLKFVQEKNTQE